MANTASAVRAIVPISSYAELLAREQVARHGNGEALQGVLDEALHQVGNIDSHGRGGGLCGGHLGLYLIKEKFSFESSV